MKKRLVVIIVIMIGIAAAVLLFASRKGSAPIKGGAYDEANGLARALYDRAEILSKDGKLIEARNTYKKLLTRYPDSDFIKGAGSELDRINMAILFSPILADDSFFYEVKPGDTLNKIANDYGTTVELIMKSNNLANSIIRPGMHLKISNAKFSALVDKSQNILMLKANDEVLKTYSVSTGAAETSTPAGTWKVINKLIEPTWYRTGAIAPPGSPENILGSRWLGLDIPGYGIHGTTDESTIGKNITQGCVRMKNNDIEELYSIIPVGTEVTIID